MACSYFEKPRLTSARQKEDLVGKTFGHVLVLELVGSQPKRGFIWKCKCLACGNFVNKQGGRLKRQYDHSCGCTRFKRGNKHHKWTGYEKIHGTYIARLRGAAKRRKLPWEVDGQFLWELYQKQAGRCALSGVAIEFHDGVAQYTASLDRIDSKLGYVAGNVQWVNRKVNFMKKELDEAEFVEWCGLVFRHHHPDANQRRDCPTKRPGRCATKTSSRKKNRPSTSPSRRRRS